MDFLDGYFEDEVREGFYIPAMVKRGWAAELKVLEEIDRVCKKYNIKYFAEYGTMLGTVRHKGFIPWDDDIDIGMKRADYIKFTEVAASEFNNQFHLYTYKTHKDFWHFMARVVGNTHICFEKEHLDNFYQFPYIVGIDIFVIDNICNDEKREQERENKAKFIIQVADLVCTEKVSREKAENYLNQVERLCNIGIKKDIRFYLYDDEGRYIEENNESRLCAEKCSLLLTREERKYRLRVFLYEIVEKQFALFEKEECDCIGRMFPDVLFGSVKKQKKEYYDELIRLPFENTTLPVALAYDDMLKKRYGNYMDVKKDISGHDYPFFENQKRELNEVLKNEGVLGIDDTRIYRYDEQHLKEIEIIRQGNKSNSYKALANECFGEIDNLNKKIKCSFLNKAKSDVLGALINMQQLAIELGNLIELIKGSEFIVVKNIEEFCEAIFNFYRNIESDKYVEKDLSVLICKLNILNKNIEEKINLKEEVVFVVSQIKKWKYIEKTYNEYCNDEKCDVKVIIVPYYYKNFDGSFSKMVYEKDEFSNKFGDKINTVDYKEYNFKLNFPEKIIIQNPFDQYNDSISLHTFFYSENLKKYTDKLIYIPDFIIDAFDENDYREYKNMKYYCLMPGVINADRVVLNSEKLKNMYVRKLCEFAGEKTLCIWNKKISVEEKFFTPSNDEEFKGYKKKRILFYTGLSGWLQYKNQMVKKIANNLEMFEKYKNEVEVIWKIHPMTDEIIRKYINECYDEYKILVERFTSLGIGKITDKSDDELVEESDAYFGDTDALARKCKLAGKPVMLEDVFI